MKYPLALISALLLSLTWIKVFAHGPHDYGDSKEWIKAKLSSKFPEEEREFYVKLPFGYDQQPDKKYPVLFLLDANRPFKFSETSAIIELLANRHKIPQMLIVALPHRNKKARERDLTPSHGADAYLNFLEKELIPKIEQTYRTTECRLLSGHSRSGLFVFYSMLRRPDLFQAHFALSPALWFEDDSIIDDAKASFEAQNPISSFLYMNIGGLENENITNSFDRMRFVLKRNAPPALNWRADYAEFESHGTTAPLGHYIALRSFFMNRDNQCILK